MLLRDCIKLKKRGNNSSSTSTSSAAEALFPVFVLWFPAATGFWFPSVTGFRRNVSVILFLADTVFLVYDFWFLACCFRSPMFGRNQLVTSVQFRMLGFQRKPVPVSTFQLSDSGFRFVPPLSVSHASSVFIIYQFAVVFASSSTSLDSLYYSAIQLRRVNKSCLHNDS